MNRLLYLAIIIIAIVFITSIGTSVAESSPRRGTIEYRKTIIRKVFGKHGRDAIKIAYCESGIRPWASNGQYKGIFQMGSHERKTYGHGSGTWAQARAAKKYFVASGSSWGPWECKYVLYS